MAALDREILGAMDASRSFYDQSWLAVRGGDLASLVELLSFSDPKPSSWASGLSAVGGDYDDFDAHLSRVFITPLVNGWTLLVGGWFGVQQGEGRDHFRHVARAVRALSKRFGAAHGFTSQGRMDIYAWILAAGGKSQRELIWDGELVTDQGEPLAIEHQRRARWEAERDAGERWSPGEADVMAVARAVSVAPEDLGPSTPQAGEGSLVVTPFGAVHGVPRRELRLRSTKRAR